MRAVILERLRGLKSKDAMYGGKPGRRTWPALIGAGWDAGRNEASDWWVRGVYDRHEFSREKRSAFEPLAGHAEGASTILFGGS